MQDPYDILDSPPAGRGELEAIVAKAVRRRRQTLVASIATTAVVALGSGWAIAEASVGHPTSVALQHLSAAPSSASTQPATSSGKANSGASTASPVGTTPGAGGRGDLAVPIVVKPWTKLFVRSAGNVTIRGYEVPPPTNAAPLTGCRYLLPYTSLTFEAEVSTPEIVGTVGGFVYSELGSPVSSNTSPQGPSSALAQTAYSVTASRIGVSEGAPLYVVVAHVPSNVDNVTLSGVGQGASGSKVLDQMAPVDGWVALTATAPAGSLTSGPFATLQAYGPGHVLEHQASVSLGVNAPKILQPRVCFGGVGPAVLPNRTPTLPVVGTTITIAPPTTVSGFPTVATTVAPPRS